MSGHRGDHLFAPLQLVLEVLDVGVEFGTLALQIVKPLAGKLVGLAQLRLLLIADIVEVEKLADFLERKPEPLAAQDELCLLYTSPSPRDA